MARVSEMVDVRSRSASQLFVAVLAGGLIGAAILVSTSRAPEWGVLVILAASTVSALVLARRLRGPLIALLAFSIPLQVDITLLYRYHQGGPPGFLVTGTDVLLVLLLLLWLGDMARGQRRRLLWPASIALPAVGFLVVSILSTGFARQSILSAFQAFELVKGLLMMVILANSLVDGRDLHWALAGLMAAIVFQSSLGIYQATVGTPLGLAFLGEGDYTIKQALGGSLALRPTGTLFHANQLALYLGMTLPVVAAVLLAAVSRAAKGMAALTTIIGLAAAVLTLSRGGWLGLTISFVILTAFALRRRIMPTVQVLMGLSGLAGILILFNTLAENAIVGRLTRSDGGSALSRLPLMRGALRIIADHPLLGSGLNNYEQTIRAYDLTGEYTLAGQLVIVHNLFLLVAAEVGLIGLGLFVWLLVGLARLGLKGVRHSKVSLAVAVTVGLLAAGQHLVTHNTVDFVLMSDPRLVMLFWLLGGWLIALASGRFQDKEAV